MAAHFSTLTKASRILKNGAVAQLGERCVRNAEVVGSTPIGSIFYSLRTNVSLFN